jgi:hypothetical protein
MFVTPTTSAWPRTRPRRWRARLTGRSPVRRTPCPGPLAGDPAAPAQAQPDVGRAHRPGQADRAGTVARQIRQRLAGEKITNRLVSITDPDARPIRRGKLRQPTEFGYLVQLGQLCENARRGARGLIVPAASQIGSPNEPDLLPITAVDLDRLHLRPREVALDGGFFPIAAPTTCPTPKRIFIAGRQSASSRRTDRRLARFRVGIEGRISHLKRRYGLRRVTACADHASWATTASAPGRPGRSGPTTSTRSRSEPDDSITKRSGPHARTPPDSNSRALHPTRGRSHSAPFIRGK